MSWVVYRCLNFHSRYALDFDTTEAVEKLLDFVLGFILRPLRALVASDIAKANTRIDWCYSGSTKMIDRQSTTIVWTSVATVVVTLSFVRVPRVGHSQVGMVMKQPHCHRLMQ